MTSEERPGEGRYVWRWGRLTYEAMLVVDGVVVVGVFLDGDLLRVWDKPEGEG